MNSVATRLVVPTELIAVTSSVGTTNLVAIDFNLWKSDQKIFIKLPIK